MTRSCLVQFNRGLSHLAMGYGREAVACLQETCPAFGDRAALWLRLAEACVAEREHQRRIVIQRNPVEIRIVEACGANNLRQPFLLRCESCSRTCERCSLLRASLFARHALRLEREGQEATVEGPTPNKQYYSEVVAGATLALAYVHLELRDVAVALEWAESLLAWPRCCAATKERQDLARLYATQARAALGYVVCEREGVISHGGSAMPSSDYHTNAAVVSLVDHRDESTAWKHIMQAMKASPCHGTAALTMAWLLRRQRRYSAAKELLEGGSCDTSRDSGTILLGFEARPTPSYTTALGTPPPPHTHP